MAPVYVIRYYYLTTSTSTERASNKSYVNEERVHACSPATALEEAIRDAILRPNEHVYSVTWHLESNPAQRGYFTREEAKEFDKAVKNRK